MRRWRERQRERGCCSWATAEGRMAAVRTMAVEAAGRSWVAEDRKAAERKKAAEAGRKMATGRSWAAEATERRQAAEAAGR